MSYVFEFSLNDKKNGYIFSIGKFRYPNEVLGKVEVPSHHKRLPVTEIKDYAFEYLDQIEEIILPSTIEKIGVGAFYRMEALKRVNIPDKVTVLNEWSFYFCQKLEQVEFGTGLKIIRNNCFQRCEKLGDVEIPEGVENIGENILLNALNTTRVELPATLRYCSDTAFKSEHIKEIFFRGNYTQFCSIVFDSIPPKITLRKKIYVYENGEFVRLYTSKYNYIRKNNNSIIEINDEIVEKCEYAYNQTVEKIIIKSTVRKIKEKAFEGCINLKEIVFEEGVEEIESKCFINTSIKEIILPESLQIIRGEAFSYMQNLEKIVLPKKVDAVHLDWFDNSNCNCDVVWPKVCISGCLMSERYFNLKTLRIPEGVTNLYPNTIIESNDLKEIYFPKSLKYISREAIINCPNLEYIHIENQNSYISDFAFSNCKKLKDIERKGIQLKCHNGYRNIDKIYDNNDFDNFKEDINLISYSFSRCTNFEDFLEKFIKYKKTIRIYDVHYANEDAYITAFNNKNRYISFCSVHNKIYLDKEPDNRENIKAYSIEINDSYKHVNAVIFDCEKIDIYNINDVDDGSKNENWDMSIFFKAKNKVYNLVISANVD